MPLEDFVVADEPDALRSALANVADLDVVGVDVERADSNRYWRAAALIQVGGDGRVVLVDPLAIDDLSPLQAFLADRDAVLHAMENDLPPLASAGIRPKRVEDTSVAAAMLGLPVGLETLLADLLGVELDGDKQVMQRADWEKRPLSPKMLAYAAGDVADLPALWEVLARRLDEAGRSDWYRQEIETVLRRPLSAQRRSWKKIKGVGRLSPPQQARLRALWQVREQLARETDTAPARIIGDRGLVELAAKPAVSEQELGRRGMRRQAVRTFGRDLLAALNGPPTGDPDAAPLAGRRPTEQERAAADRLRELRAKRADALGIDPGVLCPNRVLLGAVLTAPRTPEELRVALELRAWQWEQLGYAFCGALGIAGPGKPAPVAD